ncbi:2-hydroxyacyl-CoA dehydratase [Zongyangia hominis]|uniref:2-hydroxyacyl-CoA dehydratase n=1 Tax=Zongyangia hominis TaxID=2763677 RepID=A0A926IB07_9FIRM|nr:2-hydroxyacyl-CoA dehydratase [Zongyangia hominis]MBC8569672.1 2-hydroxyacyl-CoA dehydratase [Zongyangia hominis]
MSKPQDNGRVIFTEEMKKTHTILVPNMLPIHFNMIAQIFREYGYKIEVLSTSGRNVVESGLKNVHNDTCYPALLVIGQMIDALESGKYDPDKIALMITQTGGGCRASNYIHLLRKALKKSGYDHVPVISLNFAGMEKNPGFKLSLPLLLRLVYAVLLGDLLMLLSNQCKPYEVIEGATDKLVQDWTKRLSVSLRQKASYKQVKEFYREIISDFGELMLREEEKIKVGVVGEIYVKYSPLGNNNLEQFLLSEGCEVVVPGLLDFLNYCIYNAITDHKLYGTGGLTSLFSRVGYKYMVKKQKDIIAAIEEHGKFRAAGSFDHTKDLVLGYINRGVKMGEGWLLTAEMLELIEQGVNNIVCTQPFGCLPNHIVGKGMMRVIKEHHPEANIVAVDYDPGASRINQENRIKLMLANAKMQQEAKEEAKEAATPESAAVSEEDKVLIHSK